jgi:hypothetical protein
VGFTKSMALIVSLPPNATISAGASLPAPVYDPRKPTVAILLGNTPTEATDFLGRYAMFAEAEVYKVYAIAASPQGKSLENNFGSCSCHSPVCPLQVFLAIAATLHLP